MNSPGLVTRELAALGSDRADISRFIGVTCRMTFPRAGKRHVTVLGDRAFAGLDPHAGRAFLIEHGVTVAQDIRTELSRHRLAARGGHEARFRATESTQESLRGLGRCRTGDGLRQERN